MSCVEIHALLRLPGFPEILRQFFSYVENNAFLRFLHLRGILRFLDTPTSGPWASLGTYDSTFLRFLRLRGILSEFSSYVEKNAFLRFLHLRRILRFLDPPNSDPLASLGTYVSCDSTFLRFLRLRGILREFSSYGEKNAFLRFLHLRRILRFLEPPNSGIKEFWKVPKGWSQTTVIPVFLHVRGELAKNSTQTKIWEKRCVICSQAGQRAGVRGVKKAKRSIVLHVRGELAKNSTQTKKSKKC